MTVEDRILQFLLLFPEDEWVSGRDIHQACKLSEGLSSKALRALWEERPRRIERKAIPKYPHKEYVPGGPMAPYHYRLTANARANLASHPRLKVIGQSGPLPRQKYVKVVRPRRK